MEWYCPNCGAEIRSGAHFCPNCGAKLDDWEPNKKQYQYQEQPQPEPFYQNPDSRDYFTDNSFIPDSRWPVKSKIVDWHSCSDRPDPGHRCPVFQR